MGNSKLRQTEDHQRNKETRMNVLEFSPKEHEALAALVTKSDQALVEAGQSSATHAFNLGCSLSLLPAAILVILAFLLTRAAVGFLVLFRSF